MPEGDAGEGGEQEPPAPGAGGVGHEGHEDDAAEIHGVGGAECPAHRVPIDAAEEQGKQAKGEEQGNPDPPTAQLDCLQTVVLLGFDERDGLYYNARATVKPLILLNRRRANAVSRA